MACTVSGHCFMGRFSIQGLTPFSAAKSSISRIVSGLSTTDPASDIYRPTKAPSGIFVKGFSGMATIMNTPPGLSKPRYFPLSTLSVPKLVQIMWVSLFVILAMDVSSSVITKSWYPNFSASSSLRSERDNADTFAPIALPHCVYKWSKY